MLAGGASQVEAVREDRDERKGGRAGSLPMFILEFGDGRIPLSGGWREMVPEEASLLEAEPPRQSPHALAF
jgi:hypothetical protein